MRSINYAIHYHGTMALVLDLSARDTFNNITVVICGDFAVSTNSSDCLVWVTAISLT